MSIYECVCMCVRNLNNNRIVIFKISFDIMLWEIEMFKCSHIS